MQKINCLSEDQVKDLEKVVFGLNNATHVQDRLVYLLLIDCGLRVSELCGLQYGDIFIQQQIGRAVRIRAEIAKRSKSREIPISSRLKNHLMYCQTTIWKSPPSETDWLIAHEYPRRPVSPRYIQRKCKTWGAFSNIPKLHPHLLRHTCASRWMRVAPLAVVQSLLGHKNLSSTQVYLHPSITDLQTAIDKADRARYGYGDTEA